MNNIQRTIVCLLISAVAWVVLEPWDGELVEGPAILWLVITAAVGFFLFRTRNHNDEKK
tara:strand:+ start:241 stop:417 length:177 start_codon:yes stop_codon:yes gene_type:complete